jgi:hypothetical protein
MRADNSFQALMAVAALTHVPLGSALACETNVPQAAGDEATLEGLIDLRQRVGLRLYGRQIESTAGDETQEIYWHFSREPERSA